MRVLLSSFVPWWNAEAAYAAALAEGLLEAGHRVWMLTQPGTPNARELGKKGLPLITDIPAAGYNPLLWGRALAALRELQARESIEIVDVFRSQEFPLHLLAARGPSAPRVVRTRGTARGVRGGWLNRKLYRDYGHGLVASSRAVREEMCRRLRLAPEKIPVIYFPVDVPPLPRPPARAAGRQRLLSELGVTGDRFLIGMVGRIAAVKGHRQLLQAMAALVRNVPRALLVILAKPADAGGEGEISLLQATVAEMGLTPHVRVLGVRRDVREWMGWMELGVVPSVASEMNCRVAVEFFSVGTPVVAFPTGALPEVVEHRVSGWVTASHDPAELAQAMATLATDPALRSRLAAGARRRAETRFTRARFVEETLAVFHVALAAP